MKASFLVLLPLFVAIALARPLNPKNSLWAVNCGSTNSKRATVGIVLDAVRKNFFIKNLIDSSPLL
jgi:hypothetical protein